MIRMLVIISLKAKYAFDLPPPRCRRAGFTDRKIVDFKNECKASSHYFHIYANTL
jgi:hypothetical protein